MEIAAERPLFSRRAIITLLIPLIIEQLLAMAVGMADTIMVASVGEAAVSSVSLVNYFNNLVNMLISALATGGAVVVAQYIGHGELHEARVAAKQLIYTVTSLMLVVAALVASFRGGILHLIYGDLESEVLHGAEAYFLYTGLSFPFLGLYNACAALFRSMGNSRISMRSSFIMNIINVIGNAILIYVFHMGAAGAGIATLISRVVAALVMIPFIQRRSNTIYLEHPLRFKPNFSMIRRILGVGIPSGVENSIFQIGKLLVQGVVASMGTVVIAANSILDSIWGIVMIPAMAVNLALITVVGQCVGAGRFDEAKRNTWGLIGLSTGMLILVGIPSYLFRAELVGLFNLSPEATAICLELLPTILLINILLWPLGFSIPVALRSAGDVRFTMVVAILSMWIFRVGCCYLYCRVWNLGLAGTWYAMFTDWICRIICFQIRFGGSKWKTKSVIAH